ncbi:MAG: hypothetical protein ACT4PM_13460 [Gemmatimonadales bacterium]
MKAPLLVTAVSLAGLIALACSKPDAPAAARERNLELLGTAANDSAVVTPVEVAQGMRLPVLARRSAPVRWSTAVRATPESSELELSPKIQVTTVASAAAPALSEVPVPAGPLSLASSEGNGNSHAGGSTAGGGSGGEPTILIRGGMGGPRDDCKIHGTGRAGIGVLINRLAPPLRGGRSPVQSFGGPVRIR